MGFSLLLKNHNESKKMHHRFFFVLIGNMNKQMAKTNIENFYINSVLKIFDFVKNNKKNFQ